MKQIIMGAMIALMMAGCGNANASKQQNNNNSMKQDSVDVVVDLETTAGNVRVRLYGDTPAHRDNFVKLVNEGYYDGTLFHRIIKDFMIQGGDPDSRDAAPGKMLGTGGPDYTLQAEIVYPKYFHKRGALAAARQGDQVNPERRSSGSQFYIVTGEVYNDSTLKRMEQNLQAAKMNEVFQRLRGEYAEQIKALSRAKDRAGLDALRDRLVEMAQAEAQQVNFTPEQREAYTTVGGTPHLDGQYTVFGEVVSGMDVVDSIQQAETNPSDRPLTDIKILSARVVEP